jgi:hypothetical protein
VGDQGEPSPRVPAVVRELGVALFFLVLAAIALRPLAQDLKGSTLVGPDPLIDLWTVDWLSGHLLTPSVLYEGNIFAPARHAVVYSDLSLGTAVLVAPLRILVHDPIPLYNLSLGLALAFGGWSFCALGRHLTGSIPAGLLAGTLAAFSSHQMNHIYHLNLLSIGWLALFVLALDKLPERPSATTALLLAISFTLTAQSSGYYAVAALVLALLFALLHLRELTTPRTLAVAAGAALLALVLMAPYLRAYREVRSEEHLRRPLGMSETMAFHPSRDLSSVSYVDRAVLGTSGERLFPGFLVLLLSGVAFVRRAPRLLFPLAGTLLMFVLSLGPRLGFARMSLPLPYRLLFAIPAFDGMRHPYTFAAVGVFLLAVVAAQGFACLELSKAWWGGGLVVALGILETLAPPPGVRSFPSGIPPVYELTFALPPGVLLEVPPFEPDTLLWAARHQRPVANGAGAFAPSRSLLLERYIQNHWIARVPRSIDDSPPTDLLLNAFDVRYVVLPVGRRPGFAPLARAFDGSHIFAAVGTAPNGDRVYEIRRDQPIEEREGKSREK